MENQTKTVIIVGGGLAGACATIEAHNNPKSRVFLVEKEKEIGGNSAKASSGINAVGTRVQREWGVEDSVELFVKDTVRSGQGLSDEVLVNFLVEKSASAEEFLESHGVQLDVLSQLGGHSAARTHRPRAPPPGQRPVNVGYAIISALKSHINSLPKERMTVIKNAHVTQLVVETVEGKKAVRGVIYKDSENTEHKIEGDAVILATGGFSYNSEMIKKFAPKIAHLSTTNGNFAMGEGLELAAPFDPALRLMDKIQVHPTSFVDPNDTNAHFRILAPEALRGSGGILLNHEGKRFVNELGLRDYVTKNIFANCRPISEGGPVVAFLLLSLEAVGNFQRPNLGFYLFKKLVREFESVRSFGEEFGIDGEVLVESINTYNQSKKQGGDEFGKKTFPASFCVEEPVFAMMVTPGIHYTMGGLRINTNCQVENQHNNEPIPGLFAAGEVTGGLHGANRLGGNSLLECAVFGRTAGQQASK